MVLFLMFAASEPCLSPFVPKSGAEEQKSETKEQNPSTEEKNLGPSGQKLRMNEQKPKSKKKKTISNPTLANLTLHPQTIPRKSNSYHRAGID